jgi:hypothetical protein
VLGLILAATLAARAWFRLRGSTPRALGSLTGESDAAPDRAFEDATRSGEQVAAERKERQIDEDEMGTKPKPSRLRWLASAGLVASGLIAGGILAGTQIAGAQTPTPTASASASAGSGSTDPATVDHGPGETLLTDGTADKVKAAALAEVPGGTIIRVETDSEGSPYEAHVRKSDGSIVTVKIDKDFNVTSTESGFGGGGPKSGDSNGSGA